MPRTVCCVCGHNIQGVLVTDTLSNGRGTHYCKVHYMEMLSTRIYPRPEDRPSERLTPAAAARLLGVCPMTLYRCIKQGRIAVHRASKAGWMTIDRAELIRYQTTKLAG